MTQNIRPLLLLKDIPVQGYDIDVLGIVSNIVYVRWFEDLRMHFLDTYYPYQTLLAEQKSPILAETHVNYKYPVVIEDKIQGLVWLSFASKSRWECAFEIKSEEKIHVTGIQSGYFVDTVRKKPTRIPDKLIHLWEEAKEN